MKKFEEYKKKLLEKISDIMTEENHDIDYDFRLNRKNKRVKVKTYHEIKFSVPNSNNICFNWVIYLKEYDKKVSIGIIVYFCCDHEYIPFKDVDKVIRFISEFDAKKVLSFNGLFQKISQEGYLR